jgi:hypothetical protein
VNGKLGFGRVVVTTGTHIHTHCRARGAPRRVLTHAGCWWQAQERLGVRKKRVHVREREREGEGEGEGEGEKRISQHTIHPPPYCILNKLQTSHLYTTPGAPFWILYSQGGTLHTLLHPRLTGWIPSNKLIDFRIIEPTSPHLTSPASLSATCTLLSSPPIPRLGKNPLAPI